MYMSGMITNGVSFIVCKVISNIMEIVYVSVCVCIINKGKWRESVHTRYKEN